MAIEHIRLSKRARELLIRLKRYTGIEHWKALYRWAFCRSLGESNVPPQLHIAANSNVETCWKVFGGRHQELYMALLKERSLCGDLGVEDDVLAAQFRPHLHRGIAYLANDRQVRDCVTVFVAQAIA